MPALVNKLETLFREMWRDYERGELPRPELSNLDAYLEVGCLVNHDEIEVQTLANYAQFWIDLLMRRHQVRPLQPDRRLHALGAADIGQ
jgi:deoxyribodipyrimidine photolyase